MLRVGFLAVLATFVVSLAATAQTDTVLAKWDFEADTGGWMTPDPKGKISRTNAPDAVFQGQYSLEFSYRQRSLDQDPAELAQEMAIPGAVGVGLPEPPAGLKSLRFAVAALYSVPVIVTLVEGDGSSYMALVWCEAGTWNECQLSLSDFRLDTDSSQDENGQLDPEQVNILAFIDGSLFARVLSRLGIPVHVEPETDSLIWLDEVVLSAQDVDETERIAPQDAERGLLDRFTGSTIHWAALGGEDPSLTLATDEATSRRYLRVRYVTPQGKLFGLVRQVPAGRLARCRSLTLDIRCEIDATLALVLDMGGQNQWFQPFSVQAAAGWQRIELPIAGFTKEGVAGGTPDLAQVRRIVLVDLLPMTQNVMSANTWELRELSGIK